MERIVIHLEGGLIHGIEGIPAGVVVEVRDFDLEGVEEDRITVTTEGEAVVSEWASDDAPHVDGETGRAEAENARYIEQRFPRLS